jgi:hypothetical protein
LAGSNCLQCVPYEKKYLGLGQVPGGPGGPEGVEGGPGGPEGVEGGPGGPEGVEGGPGGVEGGPGDVLSLFVLAIVSPIAVAKSARESTPTIIRIRICLSIYEEY